MNTHLFTQKTVRRTRMNNTVNHNTDFERGSSKSNITNCIVLTFGVQRCPFNTILCTV